MATTPTSRLALNKQDQGDTPWDVVMDAGFDNADARILKISTDSSYTATINADVFFGAGLNDITVTGTFTGARDQKFIVVVSDASASPDKYAWSADGGRTWTLGANMSTSANPLENGVSVQWAAIDGHTDDDRWEFVAKAGDPQDPNDIDGADLPLVPNYVGQRYLAELDRAWWVATSITPNEWKREAEAELRLRRTIIEGMECRIDANWLHIKTGSAVSDDGARLIHLEDAMPDYNFAAFRKDYSANWVEGHDAGGVASGAASAKVWYAWAISKEIGTVDFILDSSATGANIAADVSGDSYVNKARIGRIYLLTSGNIKVATDIMYGAHVIGSRLFRYDELLNHSSASVASGVNTFAVDAPPNIPADVHFGLTTLGSPNQVDVYDGFGGTRSSGKLHSILHVSFDDNNAVRGLFLLDASSRVQYRGSLASGTLRGSVYGYLDVVEDQGSW